MSISWMINGTSVDDQQVRQFINQSSFTEGGVYQLRVSWISHELNGTDISCIVHTLDDRMPLCQAEIEIQG